MSLLFVSFDIIIRLFLIFLQRKETKNVNNIVVFFFAYQMAFRMSDTRDMSVKLSSKNDMAPKLST